MKIVPVPEVQKPNNYLDKELDFYRDLPKRKKVPCKSTSTVVHLHEHKIIVGYENLGPNKVPKMTPERVQAHIEWLKSL
ncbi:hypothetical protein XaC1_49 [Xanthomonas phage XaC1]|nr:hypothetical protein XaC1_49 [Xanthomonas phage XaC1]